MRTTLGIVLLFAGFCANSADVRITDPSGKTLGYINDSGRVMTPSGRTTGYVSPSGRALSTDGKTRGYLNLDREEHDEDEDDDHYYRGDRR